MQSTISSSSSETGCLSEESSFDIKNAQSPEEDISDILVSTDSVVQDTVLTAKVKHVSGQAQAQLIRKVSTSTGISIPGTSKSNVHRIGKKVVKEVAEEVRQTVASKKESPMILHYD